MKKKTLVSTVTYGALGVLSGLTFVMPHHLSADYALADPVPAPNAVTIADADRRSLASNAPITSTASE